MNYAAMILEVGQLQQKLKTPPHRESNIVRGSLSGELINLGERTIEAYSWQEQTRMTDRIMTLVDLLHKAGYVSDDEWGKFLLSADGTFVPEFKMPDEEQDQVR